MQSEYRQAAERAAAGWRRHGNRFAFHHRDRTILERAGNTAVQILIFVALFGWIPLCLILFMLLPARRAAVAGLIGAWVLLPPVSIPLSGIPDYDKSMATVVGIILGTLIFQPNRLLSFRLRWFDLPALCMGFCPLISSLSNGLGWYDGLSGSLSVMFRWQLPYLIGRLYFNDAEGLRELAIGIVIGGLACVLPCLYEMRMSPLLLPQVYGIDRYEGVRMGGYRPRIFFSTGLELGMWMTAGSLMAVWLWKCGTLKRIGGYPLGTFLLPILLATTVLCRATGATALLLTGLFVLWICTRVNSKALFYALVLLAPTYYAVRIPNLWSGSVLLELINNYLSSERAGSLAFRFMCENKLVDRALEQPVWGWGGWGRNRVYDKQGKDWTATDGMWIIYLGYHGCAGLFIWSSMMLLPPWLFLKRFPVRQWSSPTVGPFAAIAMLQSLYMIDCLSNGFLNVVYIAASGGLVCALPARPRRQTAIPKGDENGHVAYLDQLNPRQHVIQGASADPALGSSIGSSFPPVTSQGELADRYKRLARTLKDQGQPVQAKAAWEHALDLLTNLASTHPDIPEFQRLRWDCANDFAWFLLNEADPSVADPLMALGLVSLATEADPGCPTYWNTLGLAFYRTGDATSAITALERSVALTNGGTPFDYVFLALAHAQLGQQEQALSWSSQADLWIQQHKTCHPELRRLHEQFCASRTAGHESSAAV
jgi:tetratricopeptide (TPR) repeat protein